MKPKKLGKKKSRVTVNKLIEAMEHVEAAILSGYLAALSTSISYGIDNGDALDVESLRRLHVFLGRKIGYEDAKRSKKMPIKKRRTPKKRA